MAEIQIQNLNKTYGAFHALKDMSLHIADGEFTVFVGPSGCGKSTALKILAGLEAASTGRILIGGEDVTDLAPGKRDIAMVFQNYALYPHLTVRQNIGFGLKMRGTSKQEIDKRVEHAAQALEITDLLDRRPRALSGGQRQRVALGRAIVREPRLFLMDEPLSNLDAALRVQMRAEITALQKRIGTTTIYVTHDQTEAMTMADRIVIMRKGVVQQIGSPDELFNRPANIFVAGFIGSPAMNFIRGTILAENGQWSVDAGSLRLPLGDNVAAAAAGYIGKEIICGIRPESLELAASGQPALEVVPSLVESLGNEAYVHFRMPGRQVAVAVAGEHEHEASSSGTLIARLFDGDRPVSGKTVRLALKPNSSVHLFDPVTEVAIS
ncbi:ABC transporter ATP-binding protein [Devosia yakushimensis]|uniref:ABC transporter ATP-binding protein n=1 Tax=Devosia yakushimensis TaxID=470028 RepID=A0ABQ5UIH2_9HYPH|nr:sn-glycerol-3-phosphate ABC transporter ATP-binding protein UgpC [Devosia yakushimensis]GLQ11413.1 ABC transporter ATP-binding protein [Devosia yakushimensis]